MVKSTTAALSPIKVTRPGIFGLAARSNKAARAGPKASVREASVAETPNPTSRTRVSPRSTVIPTAAAPSLKLPSQRTVQDRPTGRGREGGVAYMGRRAVP